MSHGLRDDPPNRFEKLHLQTELDDCWWDEEHPRFLDDRKIEYLPDASQTIVSQNESPDIPFRYSVNPYRGCAHGCSYCYARPGHEYLGFNAGSDFETKIVVKHDAPRLLREFLARAAWQCEPIIFSGVTDCYQPAERRFRLTRGCLEVARECRQPIGIITKNALVARDLDLFKAMAADRLVHVFVSITTLEAPLARDMEPRTSTPAARLRAVRMLADAGVPVGVMVAPVIPGLNDTEIPAILSAGGDAGAATASYVLLRLPLTVEPVFTAWLRRTQPLKADRVLARIRRTRRGQLSNSQWGERMRGSGAIADQIGEMFRLFRRKSGLDRPLAELNCESFVPPVPSTGQLRLFH